jgi:hypothetical protein
MRNLITGQGAEQAPRTRKPCHDGHVQPARSPAAPPLGNHTDSCSRATGRRRNRYDLRYVLWKFSTLPRVNRCGRVVASNARTPDVRVADGGHAHFSGLMLCGSVWSCPVCSAKIRHERAQELEHALSRWMALHPAGSVLLATLTMPHDRGEALSGLMDTIQHAWRRVLSGGAWMRDKADYGIRHHVRGWDATHGGNGWHPHLHAVLFLDRTPTAEQLARLEDRLHGRWSRACTERGHREPTREHGTRLELARSPADLAAYVAKVAADHADGRVSGTALEVARGDLKQARDGGRTPWQILESFASTGDCDDLSLWREWEQATFGRYWMRWSRGLKELVGLADRDDQEITETEQDGQVVYRFAPDEWLSVCAERGGQARILELAEQGGTAAVAAYVSTLLRRPQRQRKWDA